jgi:hypothetical protein
MRSEPQHVLLTEPSGTNYLLHLLTTSSIVGVACQPSIWLVCWGFPRSTVLSSNRRSGRRRDRRAERSSDRRRAPSRLHVRGVRRHRRAARQAAAWRRAAAQRRVVAYGARRDAPDHEAHDLASPTFGRLRTRHTQRSGPRAARYSHPMRGGHRDPHRTKADSSPWLLQADADFSAGSRDLSEICQPCVSGDRATSGAQSSGSGFGQRHTPRRRVRR